MRGQLGAITRVALREDTPPGLSGREPSASNRAPASPASRWRASVRTKTWRALGASWRRPGRLAMRDSRLAAFVAGRVGAREARGDAQRLQARDRSGRSDAGRSTRPRCVASSKYVACLRMGGSAGLAAAELALAMARRGTRCTARAQEAPIGKRAGTTCGGAEASASIVPRPDGVAGAEETCDWKK